MSNQDSENKYETYSDFLDILLDKWSYDNSMKAYWWKEYVLNNTTTLETIISIWNSSGMSLLSHMRKYTVEKKEFGGVYFWLCQYKMGTSKEDIFKGIVGSYENR